MFASPSTKPAAVACAMAALVTNPSALMSSPKALQDAATRQDGHTLELLDIGHEAHKADLFSDAIGSCEMHLQACSQNNSSSDASSRCQGVPTICETACGASTQAMCVGQITTQQFERCKRANRLCDSIALSQRTFGNRTERRQRHNSSSAPSRPTRPLTFLHIPKTAGTLIEELAKGANVSWGMNLIKGQEQMASSGTWTWTCNAYHTPPSFLRDRSAYQSNDVFCVTRHPYDRAVSEYTYLVSVPWGSEELPTGSKKCTPANMNSFLKHKLGQLKRAPHLKFINDCHFVPQSEYIWSEDGRQWCQHVLRLEDFPGAFNDLMKTSGYQMKVSASKHNSFRSTCPGLSARDLGAPVRELLDEIYGSDFTNLGYLKEIAPKRSKSISTSSSLLPSFPLLHLPPLVPLPLLRRASAYFSSLVPALMSTSRFSPLLPDNEDVAVREPGTIPESGDKAAEESKDVPSRDAY